MASGSGDIIIKGGSVDVIFADDLYPRNSQSDPSSHKNANRKITSVVITGDITFDSGDHPEGLLCEVTVSTK